MPLWDFDQIATELWLDAADSDTLTLNGTPVAGDAGINQWLDKSGYGRDAIQSGAAGTRMIRKVAAQNGRDTVRGNGTSQFFFINNSTSLFPFLHLANSTVFVVWQHGTTANPNAFYTVLDSSDFAASQGFTLVYDDRASLSRNDNFRVLANRNSASAFIYSQAINNASAPNRYTMWGHIGQAAHATAANRSEAFVDGTALAKTSTATNSGVSSSSLANMYIGRTAGGVGYLAGDICEIVICSFAMTTDQRQIAEGRLAHKWGLTGLLPGDHPYKSAAPEYDSGLLLKKKRIAMRGLC